MNRHSSPSALSAQSRIAQVPGPELQRSSFDRTSGYKSTFSEGDLIPFFVDEVLPGDTMSLGATMFCRVATLMNPIMDNLALDTFYFFVPNRLVWDNWQKFCGEQIDPGDSTAYAIPEMTSPAGGYDEQSLFDYMGLPTKVAGYTHSTLPLRAFNLIWNQWFRDENLQDALVTRRTDGGDLEADFNVVKRGKRHDYFTSCLPWPQKGDAVTLALGVSAPVSVTGGTYSAVGTGVPTFTAGVNLKGTGTTDVLWSANLNANAAWVSPALSVTVPTLTGSADLTVATAVTVNQLRDAIAVQGLLERDARGGTRYPEILRAHFGVISEDARLQRAEFLGAGSVPILVKPVEQTTDATYTSVGNLRAYGLAGGGVGGFVKSFTEHGYVIGVCAVRADLNYQQGLHRMWSRSTRWDFYWPGLANLGEQAVLNKELYVQGTAGGTEDDEVFGYQERWAEYRYKPSLVTGLMRSNAAQTLDVWHLAQEFASLPVLGPDFIEEAPPVDRVVTVWNFSHFLLDSFVRLHHTRVMPTWSVPGLIGRF